MLKGLFHAASGMKARMAMQEIISHNLANTGTAGFQREIATIQMRDIPVACVGAGDRSPPAPISGPVSAEAQGLRRAGTEHGEEGASSSIALVPASPITLVPASEAPRAEILEPLSLPDTRPGALRPTESNADLALDGQGYFVVQTKNGPRMIRSVTLHVNEKGQLATADGDPLQSTDDKPILSRDRRWSVDENGRVIADGREIGQFRLVLPEGPIQREGAHLLAAVKMKDVAEGSVQVRQGFLERSNVDAVREMVDMIAGLRAYETSQRAVTAQDETLQRLFEVVRS